MPATNTLRCDKCRRPFEPTPQQQHLMERARTGRLKLAIVACPFCKRGITLTAPNPSTEERPIRCPRVGCTGWVSNILSVRVAEPPPEWGCGECGEVWMDNQGLHKEIAEIVARYPHRAAVYRPSDGEWQAVALVDEPKDYERVVETTEQGESTPTRRSSRSSRTLVWEVVEREGIGPVRLGMAKRAVRALLGTPDWSERAGKIGDHKTLASDRFLSSAVHVEYADQRVAFVGVNRGNEVDVVLRGVHVFDVLFRELAPWLAGQSGVNSKHDDFPSTWVFPELALCLWRESDELEFKTRPPPGLHVKSSLRLDQIAIDARFSKPRTRARCEPMPAPAPGLMKRQPADVWQDIEERDPGSMGWAALVARLRLATRLPRRRSR